MLFALITRDKPGALDLRMANREAHLAYVKETGVVTLAGPFTDENGEMNGSMIVLDVEDQAAAEAWAQDDPYQKAGLFEDVQLRPWKRLIG